MDEQKLIDFINNKFNVKRRDIITPFGDDAFCFNAAGTLAITKDMLIENTHFKTAWSSPAEIGYKAVSVNISDLASMGGASPLFLFVGLGVPQNTKSAYIKNIYKGIAKACKEYGCIVAGGDTVRAEKITVSITAVGKCLGKPITRRGAKAGDLVFATGTLGDSAAGLDVLSKGVNGYHALRARHKTPRARLKESGLIAAAKPTAMMDISDGLAESLRIMSGASGVGFDINVERLPLSQQLRKYCKINRIDPYQLAIAGGEDFELLFTISKANAKVSFGTCIGEVVKGKNVRYLFNGKETKIKHSGFKHF